MLRPLQHEVSVESLAELAGSTYRAVMPRCSCHLAWPTFSTGSPKHRPRARSSPPGVCRVCKFDSCGGRGWRDEFNPR
jgi:hypothetical protein